MTAPWSIHAKGECHAIDANTHSTLTAEVIAILITTFPQRFYVCGQPQIPDKDYFSCMQFAVMRCAILPRVHDPISSDTCRSVAWLLVQLVGT